MPSRSTSPPRLTAPTRKRWLFALLGMLATGACSISEASTPSEGPAPAVVSKRVERITPAAEPRALDAAAAAAAMPAAVPSPQPKLPAAESAEGFFGAPDAPALQRLEVGSIAQVKLGRGGRSVAFKITLDNGEVGYFKPEQSFSAAKWYSEIAAFHLDRTLGLGRVPPVVRRVFHRDQLRRALGRDRRRSEVQWAKDGSVQGAMVWWIPGRIKPLPYELNWERWIRVRHWPSASVTPFQRPRVWADQRALARSQGNSWRSPANRLKRRRARPSPDRPERPAELSDIILFDYLTRNIDRWGGKNANVLTRGRKGPLIFLDNAAGFASGVPRPSLLESRLHVLQRFRRSTVEAIRALDVEAFGKRVNSSSDGVMLLWPYHLRGLAERREALLEWIAECERRFGEDAYFEP